MPLKKTCNINLVEKCDKGERVIKGILNDNLLIARLLYDNASQA